MPRHAPPPPPVRFPPRAASFAGPFGPLPRVMSPGRHVRITSSGARLRVTPLGAHARGTFSSSGLAPAGGARAEGPRAPFSRITPGEHGQASVEFVVLLPAIAVVLAAAVQAFLAGQAAWEARVAARAAARANAFGHDAASAARGHLRARLEKGLIVKAGTDGDVRVSVRIPSILPALSLGRASATSHFRPQA